MTRQRRQELNLYKKLRISLGLMGILPFLLICYLFMTEEISLSNTIILSAALVLFSILLGFTLLRQSIDQLQILVRETAQLQDLENVQPLQAPVDGELQELASHFNSLVQRLDQAQQEIQEQNIQLLRYADELEKSYERLRREEQLRCHLGRYVGKDLIDRIMTGDGELVSRNQRKIVTILFADIRSFTTIAETMEPEEVVSMLNEYFSVMVDIVFANKGILDKFVGDQLMAVFGHLCDTDKGVRHALLAALEMQKAAMKLMNRRRRQKLPTFEVGIGINTGEVLIGNVGSKNRMDYTVIGDTVNAAARLEEHARGGEIIIGEQTLARLPDNIVPGKRIELKVKNRVHPITCYIIQRKQQNHRSVCSQPAQPAHETPLPSPAAAIG